MTVECSFKQLHSFDLWENVFEEVQLIAVPLQYIDKVLFEFSNSSTWELKVTAKLRKQGWNHLQSVIKDVAQYYLDNLQNIEFAMNQAKIKRDVSKLTKSFLKKSKIQ